MDTATQPDDVFSGIITPYAVPTGIGGPILFESLYLIIK
jgi:hypothetical protein